MLIKRLREAGIAYIGYQGPYSLYVSGLRLSLSYKPKIDRLIMSVNHVLESDFFLEWWLDPENVRYVRGSVYEGQLQEWVDAIKLVIEAYAQYEQLKGSMFGEIPLFDLTEWDQEKADVEVKMLQTLVERLSKLL